MRRYALVSVFMSATVLGAAAHAQNYVQPRNYNNPDVLVNLDTIGSGDGPFRSTAAMYSPPVPHTVSGAPVVFEHNLPPLLPPSMPQMADLPPVALAMPPAAIPPIADLPPLPGDAVPLTAPQPVAAPVRHADDAAHALLANARAAAKKTPAPQPAALPVATAQKQLVPVDKTAAALPPPVLAPVPLDTGADIAQTSRDIPDDLEPVQTADATSDTDILAPRPLDGVVPTVSVTGPALIDEAEGYRLVFEAQSAALGTSEKAVLDDVAAKLKTDPASRLQLRSFAGGGDGSTSAARRVSLARALQVRSYLTQKGITASRLDVRAMGLGMNAAASEDAPADRVDMVVLR